MVKHSVIFKLHYKKGTQEEKDFLNAASRLTEIPGVQKFEMMRQVSPKNNYNYGISMEFENHQLYNQYSTHPLHAAFIENHWMPAVSDFLEIDFEPLAAL